MQEVLQNNFQYLIDAVAANQAPSEVHGIEISDIVELISEIFQQEISEFATEGDDQTEVIRQFVERVALRTTIVCLLAAEDYDPQGVQLRITPDDLTALIRNAIAARSVPLTLQIDK